MADCDCKGTVKYMDGTCGVCGQRSLKQKREDG